MGYRRVAAFGQKISDQNVSRAALRAARESWRFSRDVRDGMDLYTARQAGSTLSTPQLPDVKDGR
jgi:hypothetical protein